MSEDAIRKSENLDEDEKLEKFMRDISSDANVVDDQRIQANEDMRFVNVTGGQWEGFFDGDENDDRVKLELDVVSNHVNRFLGEWDSNRIGVEYKPDDGKTTDDDAELLNGIYRADFRNGSGSIAVDQAVQEAATCGYGAMKLATVFEDDEDPENDNMRIVWRPIANAYNAVFWDQSAQRIDKRDARWCTVLKPFTKDSFAEAYPDKDPVSAYTPDNLSFENRNLDTPDFVYVATRYEAVKKPETVFIYNNLKTSEVEVYSKEDHDLIEDELRADEFRTFVRERKVIRRSVEKTVFSGADILDDTRRISGKFIPVIPFYGYRAYVDGIEWYSGLVRKLKDAARLFNMQISQLAENAASGGQEVPIFTSDQMQNPDIQALWADKNNKPYLLVDPSIDADGNIVATGPLGYSKPPQLDGSTATLLQIVPDYIQSVTGGAPQDTLDPNVSGKAIQAMLKRENLNTRTILKNIADAIEWSGEVYQAMASEEYTTQRMMRTVGKDGTDSSTQMLKTVMDEETGTLIESNTLSGKKFRAYSDVGPQYDSMREQTVEDLKGMLQTISAIPSAQQYLPVMMSVLFDNIDGVGIGPLKDFNRRIMVTQGLVKPETPEEEALVAQLQQQQQQEDPQQKLVEAAAAQQNAEARSLDASSVQKISDSEKKQAETQKIIADIGNDQAKLMLDARKQIEERRETVLETVQSLPLQQ